MDIKLIFTDLDGTLGHELNYEIRDKITLLKGAGIKFGLITGHPFWKKVRDIGKFYQFEYLVLENGALIYLLENQSYIRLPSWDRKNKNKLQQMNSFRQFIHQEFQCIECEDPPQV